jgi:hypothetical protein
MLLYDILYILFNYFSYSNLYFMLLYKLLYPNLLYVILP